MDFDSQSGDRVSLQERIDRLCDDFEAQWVNDQRPRISDFVNQLEPDEQPTLFYELMLVELEFRLKAGERPSREDFLREFPRFSDQVSAVYLQFGGNAFATAGAKNGDTVRRGGYKPGDHIGHFELRELLGSGAMGGVWKAWDPRLQRQVAIKIPRAENLSEDEKHRFLREGRSAAQLRHPNLAAVYEVDRDGDTPYISSEFVDGENLRDYCERSKLSLTTATTDPTNRRLTFYAIADLCAEIAEALHHAHEQGVVHRDLKPANIIIDRANRPHVIDFGLAKWATDDRDLTLHGELLGTPAYMSPEQAAGNAAKLDRRTDVYSLGVILYEMLCGQCPFTGETGSIIHRIIAVEPPPVRKLNVKVPRDLETICIKALEKGPERRYATMQEMAVDLRRFARGEPILARRAGPVERSWRWVRRHTGVAAAMLAIVLILSTSGAVIRSLVDQNYEVQGYQQVRVESVPPGAHVAFVPIDNRTGEPSVYPGAVIPVRGTTPSTVWLKPGKYFVEAVIFHAGDLPDISETNFIVTAPLFMLKSAVTADPRTGEERVRNRSLQIELKRTQDVTPGMICVRLNERIRAGNPLLPKMLYVDAEKSLSTYSGIKHRSGLTFDNARHTVEYAGKRLASAAEYDAVVKAIADPKFEPKPHEALSDLSRGAAEWTTSHCTSNIVGRQANMEKFRELHVLKGYAIPNTLPGLKLMPDNSLVAPPDTISPNIGFRGVRSGTPRFVTE